MLLLVLYLVISIGTPLGHSLLLSIHVARHHSPLSTLNDWFTERAWTTMRLAEDARLLQETRLAFADHDRLHASGLPHEHPPAPNARAGTTRDRTLAPGEHEHDGFVHSHDPEPASDLASLTSHNSEHYLAPPEAVFIPSILRFVNSDWRSSAVAEIAKAVLTPPPRFLV